MKDCSLKIQGGLQQIATLDGYVIALNIVGGLPYMTLCPYTDEEFDTPHVILTSDMDWDPNVLNHTHDYETIYDSMSIH